MSWWRTSKLNKFKWNFWKAQCKLTTRCTRRGWRSNKMGGVVEQQLLNSRPWTTLGDVTNLPYNIPQSWHNNGAQLHNTLLVSNNPNFVVAPQNLDSRAPSFNIKANGNWNLMNPWKRPQGCSNQYGNLSFWVFKIFKGSPQWKILISKAWGRWEITYKERGINSSLGVRDAMHQSICAISIIEV